MIGSADGGADELAALAAGTLEPARARELRAEVAADPGLLARYGALRAAALATASAAGPGTGPADAPTAGPDTGPGTGPADAPTAGPGTGSADAPAAGPGTGPADAPAADRTPGSPRRVTRARVAVVAAAAVLAAGAVTAAARLAPDPPAPAATTDVTPVVALPADRLGTLWPDLGRQPADLGFLTEQHRVPDCFELLGSPDVLGARPVVVDGRYGVAVALAASGDRVQVVVVGRDCGPFDDAVLARTSVPR